MKKKKKSFYFEDYTEENILDQNTYLNIVKVSFSRITFLSFIFLSLLIVCSIKIVYLSLSNEKISYSKNINQKILTNRRNIVDRNGTILATNVDLYDLGIRPQLLKSSEKKNLLIKLSLILPDFDLETVSKKLNDNNFFWLEKRLTPSF